MILFGEVVPIDASPFARGRKIRRIAINDFGSAEWILLQNIEGIARYESGEIRVMSSPPSDYPRINVDSNGV
jgi:hypothetical protein